MATLVLTGVGTLVGGPLGGAVGALLGQSVDARLFAPPARQGPRLTNLAVQTSTYGGDIPKLFGRIRVAGTVIWSTDLIEDKSSTGGGKGRPKQVDYSYSASFAVLISARPVKAVGRIWADGKLLRGAAGDFKTATDFRLWTGDEDQSVDPLIASAEGAQGTPAYRGCAYAVFERLQLADFGNRIPSLSFEVFADEEDVAAGQIADALSGSAITGDAQGRLAGFAASGDSLRGIIQPLAETLGLTLSAAGERLRLAAPATDASLELSPGEEARVEDKEESRERRRGAAGATAAETSLGYFDVDRDYQAGLQRARRASGRGSEKASLPAALTASAAKSLCAARLARLWAARETLRLPLSPRRLDLRPGTSLRLGGVAGLWWVERILVDRFVLVADLVKLCERAADPVVAAPGRGLSEPDAPAGRSELLVFEAPADGELLTVPRLLVASAGASAGWRPVPLSASYDGGGSWAPVDGRAAAATGRVLASPGAAGSALFDLASTIEVELLRDEDWLENRTDAALAAGANAAFVGEEIVQFGRAEPIGERRFRLSRLLRGRRGTEWAAGAAGAGAPFVLIDAARLVVLDLPAGSVGGEVRLVSDAPADEGSQPVAHRVTGEAMRPPSPVHLSGRRLSTGGLTLSWVRRSRSGWSWADGADAPLGEEREAYRITLAAAGIVQVLETAEPALTMEADALSGSGLGWPLQIEVVQLGTHGASRPARTLIS